MKLDIEILEEKEVYVHVFPGDLFTLKYKDKILLERNIEKKMVIKYVGAFRLKEGGIGGYFSKTSQLKK